MKLMYIIHGSLYNTILLLHRYWEAQKSRYYSLPIFSIFNNEDLTIIIDFAIGPIINNSEKSESSFTKKLNFSNFLILIIIRKKTFW